MFHLRTATMKKILLSLVACFVSMTAFADAITSSPSPAVTTKALEVTITCSDMGSTVYCYTWCADINGSEVSPFTWDGVNTSKFQMTGSSGTYKFKIDDIQSFYGLTDSQMEGLTKLGFIAKTSSGTQTGDLFVSVVQGRKNAYSGGDGTQANPFVLANYSNLEELSENSMDWEADVYFVMNADIEVEFGTEHFVGIGSKECPFKGHFDGAGYSIKNVMLDGPVNTDGGGEQYDFTGYSIGIFNAIDGAEIKNLGVENIYAISETPCTGGLVGYAASGVISRCFVTGLVRGAYICTGGLVGENKGATITDCYSACKVGGGVAVGGFAGKNCGTIKNVYATGEVSGGEYTGGLVGANYGVVSNSVALNVSVNSSHNFVARFGGNNNSENKSTGNLGWTEMPHSAAWTEYGDHATASSSTALTTQSTYQSTLGWDFSSVWEWRTENGKSYAALRGLNNQSNPNAEALYNTTGIEEIIAGDVNAFRVYPNPTSDMLNVTLGQEIASCTLYGLNGSVALEAEVEAGLNALTMNIGSLANGVYMLKVMTVEGDIIINKVIKK